MNLLGTKEDAARSLASSNYNGKTLALIHTGAALLVSFILSLCNFLLSQSIESTTGLSGIGTRSILQSVQSFLSTATTLLLPFWQIGFVFACIRIARKESVRPSSLAEGFRRFGPVLRLHFLEILIFCGVAIACAYLASAIFSFTPFFGKMFDAIAPLMQETFNPELLLSDSAVMDEIVQAAIPLYCIFGLVFVALSIPIFYRLRMAQFAIMDDMPRARAAIGASFRMMRKNRIQLFRVDLQFWWFYLLKVLVAAVAYGDVLLPLVGISLPINENVQFFGFYLIYIVLELFLTWRFGALVQTTYAHCYETLKTNMPQKTTLPEV